ncbi:MAG: 4Fe-4S binding protein, partial [Sedimenticolaceae bacterium]
MAATGLQRCRLAFQAGFFLLFVLAPPLDILRIDLTRGHAILLGMDWTLGIDGLLAGEKSPFEAAVNLIWRGFI